MSPNAGNYSNLDTILLVVPQFHVMAWGFPYYACCLDQTCYPLLIYSQKLIKILEDEKVTKANGVPTIWLGMMP
jgi:fatty-acyl-CoA synthase